VLQKLVLGFRREKHEDLVGIHLFDFDTPEDANRLNNTFLALSRNVGKFAAADFPAINFPRNWSCNATWSPTRYGTGKTEKHVRFGSMLWLKN